MIVASIDIGSNTVLMLITEVSTDELKIILLRDGRVYPDSRKVCMSQVNPDLKI